MVASLQPARAGPEHGATALGVVAVRHLHLLRGHPPWHRPLDHGRPRRGARARHGQPHQRLLVRRRARAGTTPHIGGGAEHRASPLAAASHQHRHQRVRGRQRARRAADCPQPARRGAGRRAHAAGDDAVRSPRRLAGMDRTGLGCWSGCPLAEAPVIRTVPAACPAAGKPDCRAVSDPAGRPVCALRTLTAPHILPGSPFPLPKAAMEPETILVKGAREHNLKGITLEIPKKRLVVFTGVSGSGKSSLAFDTLYAEGQRRYVESLSAYARQFLGQMEKPHYDVIRGLSPTISIEQKAASNNPRSTVGTITEIHDYLRVLYAAVGKQHCTICGRRVGKQSAQQIADELSKLPEGTKLTLLAPLIEHRKGEHKEILTDARKRGYARARVDGTIRDLDEEIELDKKRKHDIAVVVDRLVVKKEDGSRRLIDSVETALKEGKGVLHAITQLPKGGETHSIYSEHLSCPVDGISFPELAPHSFSFNNPLGMCHECNGLGTRPEMDPDLIVPDASRSIRAGAVEPWNHALEKQGGWTFRMIESLSSSFKVPLDKPWKELPKETRQMLLYGSGDETMSIRWSEGGRTGTYKTSFEGIIPMLMRRFKETTSESMRKHYLRYFSDKPCSACKGERLRPESRAVSIGDVGETPGKSIVQVSRMTIEQAMQFIVTLPLEGSDRVVASELLKEIGNRLRFLLDVGLGYLTLDRPGPSLSGGESQRIRLASQMGSELTGVIYILDEPSTGR